MGFILFILTILLFGVLFVLVTGLFAISKLLGGIGNLWYLLTGKGKKHNSTKFKSSYTNSATGSYTSSDTSGGTSDSNKRTMHHKNKDGKVFSEDEGTYVEFEEIKN